MNDIAMIGGDLIATTYGDIALCDEDEDDIIQSANNTICTQLGELYWHPEYGNNTIGSRIKMSQSGLAKVEDGCKSALLYDSRIQEVLSINASKYEGKDEDGNDIVGVCSVQYTLLTVDGETLDGKTSINVF